MSVNFDGILLATDIDDTLAYMGKISNENLEAIRFFIENGGKFTVATGRTPDYIKEKYLPDLQINAPIAAINGAVVVAQDIKTPLWACPLPDDFMRVLAAAKQITELQNILIYSFDKTYSCIESSIDFNLAPYFKLLFVTQSTEQALLLKRELEAIFSDRFYFSRSWEIGLEVVNKEAGKGIAIQKIRQITKAHQVIGVGNYENDWTLLQAADTAVAVENAVDSLKAAADFITVPASKHAIASIIYSLGKNT